MPKEETPTGAAASVEERQAAIHAGDDIFNEGTTDNAAALNADPEDIAAAKAAEEKLEEEKGEDDGQTPEQNSQLADALNNLAATLGTKKEAPKVEDKPLTEEELSKLLNTYEPTDELMAELDNPDTRKAAMRKIIAGAAKEGATAASILAGNELQAIRSQLAPLLEQQKAQQEETQRQAFLTEYPALADEAFAPLLNIAAADLKKEGIVPKTVVEARKLLAERTEKYVRSIKPDFTLKSGAPKQPTKTTIPKPASVKTGGGAGGAGGSKSQIPTELNRSKGVEVFDA